jgi:hypothetical protein
MDEWINGSMDGGMGAGAALSAQWEGREYTAEICDRFSYRSIGIDMDKTW